MEGVCIMTLSFSTVINGKPNYFIEKIWKGLVDNKIENNVQLGYYAGNYHNKFGKFWDTTIEEMLFNDDLAPKLHTIRRDEHNLWGAGCDIHFVINSRTKNRFQFAPVIKCVSVQEIVIKQNHGKPSVYIDGRDIYEWDCEIENGYPALKQLANNDGFDSVEDFFAYFNKDFTGKIIHWTDLKY